MCFKMPHLPYPVLILRSDMKNLIQEACQGPLRDACKAHGADVSGLTAEALRPVVLRDFQVRGCWLAGCGRLAGGSVQVQAVVASCECADRLHACNCLDTMPRCTSVAAVRLLLSWCYECCLFPVCRRRCGRRRLRWSPPRLSGAWADSCWQICGE